MNIILNTPIQVTLTSGLLIQESDGIGTIAFTIDEQPISLALTSSSYTYDTVFSVGDRVRLIESFGSLGLNSEGILQEIIIDSTQDKADVLFDTIYPNQYFDGQNFIDVASGDISVLIRVPLSILEIV